MKSTSFFSLLFAALILVTSVGCPDYSHLREVPDYQNMTDAGDETFESEQASEAAAESESK